MTTENDACIIIGAGHAAASAVGALRAKGFAGRIVLLGDEPDIPYHRPPLSKRYLAGDHPAERMAIKPQKFYDDNRCELRLGRRATRIERGPRTVTLDSGESLGYTHLLFATGARARHLTLPGADLPGVHTLRTRADVDAIRARLANARRLAIVGGGYIGLEAASIAAERKLPVTVIEMAERVLSRVTTPEMSAYFERLHRAQGVEIACATPVDAFDGEASGVRQVACGGRRIDADLVIVGAGILPNIELAAEAGLACDNGILVDDRCRTSDPAIYAAGDCSNHPNPYYKRRLRLESVQNATDQAAIAAANICGADMPYAEVPWFWSNQYDVRLQIAGLFDGYDQTVTRGDPESKAFARFYLREGRLLAVDAINMAREYMAARQLIAKGVAVDPVQLADPAAVLKVTP